MTEIRVNPTRMELKKLKNRRSTAKRGHKLLKDKRDELMRQFLEIVRRNKILREKVEAQLEAVHSSFSVAAAVSSPAMLESALMLPKKDGELDVNYKNLISVSVPVFNYNSAGSGSVSDKRNFGAAQDTDNMYSSLNYGFAFTSGELDSAVAGLTALLPDMIALAESEKSAQMLAAEIEKTRRRVNALEYIMIPQYDSAIKRITMKLDENERGNTTRLMKVKDMMLQAHIEGKR